MLSASTSWRIGDRFFPHVLWLTIISHFPFTRKHMQCCCLPRTYSCCTVYWRQIWQKNHLLPYLIFLLLDSLLASISSAGGPYVTSQENILPFLCQRLLLFTFYSKHTCWLEKICHKRRKLLLKDKWGILNTWIFSCPQPKMGRDYQKF